jgi:site-specific DNA recombinase
MPTGAVIYARVSTAEQAETGRSIDAQLDACRRWCDAHETEVIGLYKEPGVSGIAAARPELDKALAAACRHKAVLVSYSLSRLARSTLHLLQIVARLEQSGAGFASCSENIDTTSPMGRLVFTLFAALSQFERDVIAERTASVMAYKIQQREFTGGRRPPIGWALADDGRHIVPDPQEQGILVMIRELAGSGKTAYAIAKHLNAIGMPCPGQEAVTGEGAKAWHIKTVDRILGRMDRLIAE